MVDPLTGQWVWVHVGTGILTPHLDAIKRASAEYEAQITKGNSAEPGAGSTVTRGGGERS